MADIGLPGVLCLRGREELLHGDDLATVLPPEDGSGPAPPKLRSGVLGVEFELRQVNPHVLRQIGEEEVGDQVVQGHSDIVVLAENGVSDESIGSADLESENIHLPLLGGIGNPPGAPLLLGTLLGLLLSVDDLVRYSPEDLALD